MEAMKKKKSITTAYYLLNLFLGIGLGAILIYAALYVYHFIDPGYHFPNYWSRGISSKTAFIVSDKFGFISVPAKIEFRMDEIKIFLSFLHVVIILSGTSAATYYLMKITKNVFDCEPFRIGNIKNLKMIGYIAIITPIIEGVIKIYLLYSVEIIPVVSKGMSGAISWSVVERIPEFILSDLYFLVGGLIFLVLSHVFEYGTIIKQENDLTV